MSTLKPTRTNSSWLQHAIPLQDMSLTSLAIIVTWPYHRTLRHFTLSPAAKLARSLDLDDGHLHKVLAEWTRLKTSELDFVRKASTVAAAGVIGIFSWNEVASTFWVARALFYLSLSLSIWAVLASAQQTSVIHALPASPKSRDELRHVVSVILRHTPERRRASRSFAEMNMLYVWQVPVMQMSYAIVTMMVALTLHVCSPLIASTEDSGRKIAIFYLGSGVVLLLNFAWTSAWVYWTPEDSNLSEEQGLSTTSTLRSEMPKQAGLQMRSITKQQDMRP